MFFPKAMTELELIVPAKDLVAVTKVLGSRGNFQQIDSTYLGLENLGNFKTKYYAPRGTDSVALKVIGAGSEK